MHLIESVVFDSPAPASDGQGGQEEGWTQRYACRANFRYLRGGEAVQSARLEGKQPIIAKIRQCAAIAEINSHWVMRDVRRSHVYNIKSIEPSQDRLWLDVYAVRSEAI